LPEAVGPIKKIASGRLSVNWRFNLKLRYTGAVRVISNKTLLAFSASHQDAGVPLQLWRKAIEARAYTNFASLKTVFGSIDKVSPFHVFDLGGNKYRLIAAIHYNRQILFVRHIFTHRQYDQWKPK
jgi:mRNA interferase HigB